MLASYPGHSQILSRSRGEKLGEGLGSLLCHGSEMVDLISNWTQLVQTKSTLRTN